MLQHESKGTNYACNVLPFNIVLNGMDYDTNTSSFSPKSMVTVEYCC